MTVRNCKEYEHVCSCENLDRLTGRKNIHTNFKRHKNKQQSIPTLGTN